MPQFTKHPTIVTFYVTVRPELKSHFVDWQAKLNAVIAGFDGFISLEFLSSSDHDLHWVIVQRFYDEESSSLWRESAECQALMAELRTLLVKSGLQEKTEGEANLRSGVTEVIITQVNPEKEEAYREWSAKIHQIEAKFPGFRGVYIQSPKQRQGRHWITMLQFDTPENLDRWLESNERQEILKESAPLVSSLESHRVASPYAGWFYSIAKTEEIPSVWKQSMVVLLILFPIVMLQLKYLSPLTKGMNTALSTFIGNSISVTLIGFPMMPIVIGLLGWWLFPKHKKLQMTIIGTLVVLLVYLIEILVFWNFF